MVFIVVSHHDRMFSKLSFTDCSSFKKKQENLMLNQIIKKLENIVGSEWVRTDRLTRYHYSNDVVTHISSGKMYAPNPPLVIVFPGSTKDVQSILRLASKNNIPLYAIGGGTVLLIGSVPGKPDIGITLDFHRMQKVEVDQDRMVIKVQPGATGIQVSQLVRDMGFGYRPFLAAVPDRHIMCPISCLPDRIKWPGTRTAWESIVPLVWR
jgi:hypothetical protein